MYLSAHRNLPFSISEFPSIPILLNPFNCIIYKNSHVYAIEGAESLSCFSQRHFFSHAQTLRLFVSGLVVKNSFSIFFMNFSLKTFFFPGHKFFQIFWKVKQLRNQQKRPASLMTRVKILHFLFRRSLFKRDDIYSIISVYYQSKISPYVHLASPPCDNAAHYLQYVDIYSYIRSATNRSAAGAFIPSTLQHPTRRNERRIYTADNPISWALVPIYLILLPA